MKRELEPYQLIERSIIKKYRKELWTPFIVAVKRYELVQAGDRIVFGATVELEDEDGKINVYQIVGDDEADIKQNRISVSSPVARSLIGKYEGDEVTCPAPKGLIHYAIVSVKYI